MFINANDYYQPTQGVIGTEVTFADMQIPDDLETIEILERPRVNVERVDAEPRVITERIVGQPVYASE